MRICKLLFTKKRCIKTLLPEISTRFLQGKTPRFASQRHSWHLIKTAQGLRLGFIGTTVRAYRTCR